MKPRGATPLSTGNRAVRGACRIGTETKRFQRATGERHLRPEDASARRERLPGKENGAAGGGPRRAGSEESFPPRCQYCSQFDTEDAPPKLMRTTP